MLRSLCRLHFAKYRPCVSTCVPTQTRHFAARSGYEVVEVDNPYSGKIACFGANIAEAEANKRIAAAHDTFATWRQCPLEERKKLVLAFCDAFEAQTEAIALDITHQMGKPLQQARGEVSTMLDRARKSVEAADRGLAEEVLPSDAGAFRKLTKEPVGPVLVMAPWNYPLLCSVNAVVPAILSGCPVLLKMSNRTPRCADHFVSAFAAAGAPAGLIQSLQASHDGLAKIIQNPSIQYVAFTGSVGGGHSVYRSVAQNRFIDCTLELGGKDAAYVRADADVAAAVAGTVDGSLYNAGQSCCGIERVYVHDSIYNDFVSQAEQVVNGYVLGDPTEATTTMGPMAQQSALPFLKGQVDDAVKKGARLLCGGAPTTDDKGLGRFFQPTLLADCTHDMTVMMEESFGPIMAIQRVSSDEEAVQLVNDSPFGLTSSVWTKSKETALQLTAQFNTGTVFMNRCDFVDPQLAWSGRQDSGKGVSLSHLGFQSFVRTKSYNFRV